MDLIKRLQAVYERYQYLEERMSDPSIVSDVKEYTKISKDYKDLLPIIKHYEEFKKLSL